MVKVMGSGYGDGCFRVDYVKLLTLDHSQSTKMVISISSTLVLAEVFTS